LFIAFSIGAGAAAGGGRRLALTAAVPDPGASNGGREETLGLIIMAVITTALALGGLFVLLTRAADWRPLALAFVVALPLQPLAFFLVRLPIDGFLRTTFGMTGWVAIVAVFYAPLTEEPAKWLTALVPAVRRAIGKAPVHVALAVGLGFGIGEIWFLVYALVSSPNLPEAPFWMFSGFLLERLEVCFLHGCFVIAPFMQLARGRSFLLGGLAGVTLHFMLNFPIFLAQTDAFALGPATWAGVLLFWVVAFVIIGAIAVRRLTRGPFGAPAAG
jgi:hypothetical protein